VSAMSTADEHVRAPASTTRLVFDTGEERVVAEHRTERTGQLSHGDRVALVVMGAGFLLVALALTSLVKDGRAPGTAVLVVYVAVYALVSRVEFEVFTGASVPTELVLVPMLFVLPLGLVPLAIACGLVLGSLIGWARGETALERSALSLIGSWHAVGPVLVLWTAGVSLVSWRDWPILTGALAAQFVLELASIALAEWIARETSPRALVPHVARSQLVDAALAPAGLVVAFAAQSEPYAVLLLLPLVGVLRVFAGERRARIDSAIELMDAYRGTAFLLGDVVEADDTYTGLHSRDVVGLCTAVADELGLPPEERRDVEFTALLHDVGKIRVPSEIVNKPGPLTPDERAVMEEHTVEGERLLERVGGLLGNVGRMVRSCHERWDGEGYPDGLAGTAIPRVARIVSCCDAFSAMTTDRPYRRALDLDVAVAELWRNAGTQFDPEVAAALVAVVSSGTVGDRVLAP
jgi:HD-GYP domain-containing protein (c-di-GMP phosphodiesterase class II)